MRDKNTVIGWLLIALVFIGFTIYNGKNAEKQRAALQKQQAIEAMAQAKTDSIAKVEAEKKAAEAEEALKDSTDAFFAARQNGAGTTEISNDLLKVTLSNEGGQVVRAELLDETYKNQQGGHVVLMDGEDSKMQLTFEGKEMNIRTLGDGLFFAPAEQTDSSVVMRLPVKGGSIDIAYTLHQGSYILSMDVTAQNLEGIFPANASTMGIKWDEKMRQQEKGYSFENRYSTITYRKESGKTKELSSGGADKHKGAEKFEGEGMKWVAFKTQFFSQILIADGTFGVSDMSSKYEKEGSGYLKDLSTQLTARFDPTGKEPTKMNLYLGPNKFKTLKANEKQLAGGKDLDLQSIVYLGWPIVRWINRYIFLYIFDWMTGWGLNMGIVLLIITLVVKFAVFPLMRKSFLSGAKMRVLRPKMDEINKKYPNPADAMQKQQEMMQMYSQYGVSPMGGCLPMLIQMPIWIALFNFIPNAIELRGQSFLWANDLSTYDDVISWGPKIWGLGNHLSIFCLLWALSTLVNSWISMRQQSYAMSPEQEQSMKMMKWMTYLMPIIFFFTFNSYSSGLTWYYFVSGLISILMMWYLRKTTNDDKLLAQLEERKKMRKEKQKSGGSSMMERFQRMAEQQQEILRKQQEEAQNRHKNR